MSEQPTGPAKPTPADAAPRPAEPVQQPPASTDTELDAAIAAFDARERERAAVPARAPIEPISLREIDRRVWFGLGAGIVLIGLLLGGAPWHGGFWIALAALLLVMCPIVGTAIFLWRRNR